MEDNSIGGEDVEHSCLQAKISGRVLLLHRHLNLNATDSH